MKILVTGGAGYIGSNIVKSLIKSNHDVNVIDNLSSGNIKNLDKKAKFHKIDLSDFNFLNNFLANNFFDIVIHLSSLIDVKESYNNPGKYYKVNFISAINLVSSMVNNKLNKIIFSSSASVYGNLNSKPIKETDKTSPVSPYGNSKLFIEKLLKDYGKSHNLKSICLRYFNACGAQLDGSLGEMHNPETHIIPLLMQVASGRKKQITIYGNDYKTKDGTAVRDYVHVLDITSAHIKALKYLMENQKSNIFNIGNNNGFSVMDLISKTEKITKKKIKYIKKQKRDGDVPILIADNSKIKKILKWKTKYSDLNTIIQTAWDWEKKLIKYD